MGKRGQYAGSKHRGNHSSVIPMAERLVKEAEKMEEITGIAPGFIDSRVRSRKPRVDFKIIPIGLEAVVLGNNSKQSILLYTSVPESAKAKLESNLEK